MDRSSLSLRGSSASQALRLFPLRDLTGHIISAKNIRRESGRRGAGVGPRGGRAAAGSLSPWRASFYREKTCRLSRSNTKSSFALSGFGLCPNTVTHLRIHSSHMHQFAVALAPLLQSHVSASESQPSASGAPVVLRWGFKTHSEQL